MRITLPQAKTYLPGPGICIYCMNPAAKPLAREHIIPRGLGGQLILHQASCDACSKIINKQIETPFQQHSLLAPRTKMRLNRPSTRPKELRRLRVPDDTGTPFQWDIVPAEEMPLWLMFPVFAPPGVLWDRPLSENFEMRGVSLHFGPDVDLTGTDKRSHVSGIFTAANISRQIAKIAHGAAVAELGLSAFEPLLPPLILGEDRNMAHLVGSARRSRLTITDLHLITLTLKRGYVVAIVQLFARLGIRPYAAVVGRAKPPLDDWHMWLNMSSMQEPPNREPF